MGAVLVLFNLLFNRNGMTVLFYIGDAAVTLESVLYAVFSALHFTGAVLWFSFYCAFLDADRVYRLFAGTSRGLAVIFSLSMALVPWLLKKMDKKTLWIRMSFVCAIANIAVWAICMFVFPYTSTDLTTARIGFVVYCLCRFFTNFPVGMSLVLLTAIFSDTVDVIEMESGKRLEGAVFSFRSLVNKIGIALFNLVVMAAVNAFGYSTMSTELNVLKDAGTLTREVLLTNHMPVLNAIFFMLTILGSIGLVLQALPMFKYKFNEAENEDKIRKFREEKDARLQAELDAAIAQKQA